MMQKFLHVDNKDSDQTAHVRRHVFSRYGLSTWDCLVRDYFGLGPFLASAVLSDTLSLTNNALRQSYSIVCVCYGFVHWDPRQ